MAIMDPSAFFQAKTNHKAATHRLAMSALIRSHSTGGLLIGDSGAQFMPGALKVQAQAVPNMTVRIGRGLGLIPGREANTQGMYVIANDAEISSVPIDAAHATLERTDSVVFYAVDAQYSGAVNEINYEVIKGTNAAVGTSVPVNPLLTRPNSTTLAWIVVSPGVTSIVQNKIFDARIFYVMQGGVRNIRNHQSAELGIDYGDLRYWNGRIEGWNAEATTGWRPVGVDNVQRVTGGWSYGVKTVDTTLQTIAIPDPGYPYFIEGELSANIFNVTISPFTRWDLMARLDTTGGTLLGSCNIETDRATRVKTEWLRSGPYTGTHSIVARLEKTTGSDVNFFSDAIAHLRIVPQPPAANAGVMINV